MISTGRMSSACGAPYCLLTSPHCLCRQSLLWTQRRVWYWQRWQMAPLYRKWLRLQAVNLRYVMKAKLYFVQKTFHPYALSWNHIFKKKNSCLYQKLLINRTFLRRTSCPHRNNFWSIYRHTKPNNLWAKSMILGSTQWPFLCRCSGFDAPYPSSFLICAASLGMLRNLIWVELGWEEKRECCSSGICWLVKWHLLLFMSGQGFLVWRWGMQEAMFVFCVLASQC